MRLFSNESRRGGKIRPLNMIRHFSQSGHDVTVASLARDAREVDEAGGLSTYCQQVLLETISQCMAWPRMLLNVPTATPSSFGYFYSPRLKRRIHAELERTKYDLIFVHCSSVAPYVASVTGHAKIIDYGDVDSQKWREYAEQRRFPLSRAYWLEAVKLERVEQRFSEDFDLCTCTTPAELESLRGLGVSQTSDWFANGVDAEFFKPAGVAYDPQKIAFVGRMDYFPNQQAVHWFCSAVWPKLRAMRPTLQFVIIGADPPPPICALGQLPGVTVTGSVPDVRPFVQSAALTVAPLTIARGTQNKILESMAMATPVISSPEAVGGVDAVPGEHLLVAHNVAEWVASIDALLASPDRRNVLAAAARARVLSHHSWAASMRRLDGLIANVMHRKGFH